MVFVCWCFFFKQKTAYDMRIRDWSSDVCSSDLPAADAVRDILAGDHQKHDPDDDRAGAFVLDGLHGLREEETDAAGPHKAQDRCSPQVYVELEDRKSVV